MFSRVVWREAGGRRRQIVAGRVRRFPTVGRCLPHVGTGVAVGRLTPGPAAYYAAVPAWLIASHMPPLYVTRPGCRLLRHTAHWSRALQPRTP